jgi:hypothetical protein
MVSQAIILEKRLCIASFRFTPVLVIGSNYVDKWLKTATYCYATFMSKRTPFLQRNITLGSPELIWVGLGVITILVVAIASASSMQGKPESKTVSAVQTTSPSPSPIQCSPQILLGVSQTYFTPTLTLTLESVRPLTYTISTAGNATTPGTTTSGVRNRATYLVKNLTSTTISFMDKKNSTLDYSYILNGKPTWVFEAEGSPADPTYWSKYGQASAKVTDLKPLEQRQLQYDIVDASSIVQQLVIPAATSGKCPINGWKIK